MILDKKQMTEEDIKLVFITPALNKRGWENGENITMETQITDGRINLRGNMAVRSKPKKVDYLLYLNRYHPIAVVEAKDNNHSISYGLQQAKTYAQMLDLPFAYSSNGDGFEEFDFLTGAERTLSMEEFPTVDELISRYKQEKNDGQGLNELEKKLINQPYYSSQKTFPPRYYQRNAVNRTLDAIAKGQNRILLVMATGTGKTYTAFQIVYRLITAGLKHKVLYLADRNNLVDQSIQQDFSPFEKVIHKVNFKEDNRKTITSYEIYFALYQQMVGNDETEHFRELFDPDFFDLIIVDECHRGSAKEDSRWRKVLDYFKNATQIGMTATPKETSYVSNIDYFGKPVYEYSLKRGIDDGFLAPFRVLGMTLNISDGWRPYKGQLDYFGNEIEDRIYNNSDFDYNIVLQDRVYEVAFQITEYLKKTDRMQKTIVFCATEDAAERMRVELVRLNQDMVKKNPDYVVRITGSDVYGKSKLDYFISVASKYPVIATTSDLLSTGSDCKMTKLIVLDKNINSMTQFKQIIGRGTRVREDQGKLSFTVMDFRGVSRLFADPDWDGPVEQVDNYDPSNVPSKPTKPTKPPIEPRQITYVDAAGAPVSMVHETVSIYDNDGKLLRQENIIDYTRRNVRGEYADLSTFVRKWSETEKKEAISDELKTHGIDLAQLKKDQHMEDVDDFDFITHVAYDQKPLTRKERAENVKKRDFLHKYSGVARQVIEALLDKYADEGISEIEKTEVLKLDPFRKLGNPVRIARFFGGKDGYKKAIKELEEEIYREA
ncbi:MAG: DEAD/DEAH box helicase family protein [Eubacterium sp.]|jgi:type I restriction enzyme R subunit|nr:DEAD/DEAH box helicase family protein [Eubacterium sp.]MCH4045842.1 DEAD/DEAH box helicase family protein [Eubacterium sp.]MCH4078933.1 DEAD/DEAH box helicase family protein [Eubacterium sp.]